MEELTEVITATEFHPTHCNQFMYSSSKSNIKLADMRDSALCDRHAKCQSHRHYPYTTLIFNFIFFQASKKKKTPQRDPSSQKSSPPYLTSSLVTTDGIFFLETICHSRSGTWTWSPNQSRRSRFMITFVGSYVICMKMTAFLTSSNVFGVEMISA